MITYKWGTFKSPLLYAHVNVTVLPDKNIY